MLLQTPIEPIIFSVELRVSWVAILLHTGRSARGEKVGGKSYLASGKLSLLKNLSFVSLNQELISPHCSLCLDVVYYALLGR